MTKAITVKTETIATFTAPVCVKCSTSLQPVFPSAVNEDGTWNALQPLNALIIKVDGAYGMYLDPMTRVPYFVLCGECVDALRANPENAWFNTMIEETGGE